MATVKLVVGDRYFHLAGNRREGLCFLFEALGREDVRSLGTTTLEIGEDEACRLRRECEEVLSRTFVVEDTESRYDGEIEGPEFWYSLEDSFPEEPNWRAFPLLKGTEYYDPFTYIFRVLGPEVDRKRFARSE